MRCISLHDADHAAETCDANEADRKTIERNIL